jgi:hypothetical protein
MISIIRAGYSPENATGSRSLNELHEEDSETPLISSIRRIIVVRKINPEEFEDEVNDMGEREDEDLSQEELDALESEIPAEVDSMTDEELGADDIESSEEGGESDGTDSEDMSEEELAALEKEIPPEVDQLADDDLEADPGLESDDENETSEEDESTESEPDDKDDKKEKPSKEDEEEAEEDLDEGEKLNEYI